MSNLPVPQGSIATYLVEINRFPLLSAEEEHELAVRYRRDNDIEAAQKLVTSNLRFVVKIAYEYASYGVRLADLIQEGNIGLMQAVKKFDPAKGFRLISYAVWWIRAMIQNFILKTWSLVKIGTTQAQRRLFGKWKEAQKVFARDLSLDQPLSDEGETTRLNLLASAENQEESLGKREEQTLLKGAVAKVMKNLTDRERFIVENRLMADEPMTLQQIGDRYRISRERARQIEEQTKKKIRMELAPCLAS